MYKIKTPDGRIFGGYKSITKENNAYNCDGLIYPFSVIPIDSEISEFIPSDVMAIKQSTAVTNKDIDAKLQEIKEAFKRASVKPKVEVKLSDDLTIVVDGGRTNKDDFKEEWENMADDGTTTVRDANNEFHSEVTKDQMGKIYKAIVANGKALYAKKWDLEERIKNAKTIAEVEAIKW